MKDTFHQTTPGMINLFSQVKLSGNLQQPLFSKSLNSNVKRNGGKMFGKLFEITSSKIH